MSQVIRADFWARPRSIALLGALIVGSQRLAIPVGEFGFPVMSLVVIIFGTTLVILGVMGISLHRLLLFLAIAVVGGISGLANPGSSFASLAQVLVIWAPLVLVLRRPKAAVLDTAPVVHAFLKGQLCVTAIASVFAIFQSLSGYFLGTYPDPIAALPSGFLLGGFNDSYPVLIGGSWMRANGGVFLEPSFLSLYSAMGLLLLATGAVSFSKIPKPVVALILVGGMLSTVAVSGLVVLPFVIFAAVKSARIAALGTVIVGFLYVISNQIPAIGYFVDKALLNPFDATGQVSSAARLYRPYVGLWEQIERSPIFGSGPGSARAYVATQDVEVTTPTLMKIVLEYGLLGFAIFALLAIGLVARSRLPWMLRLGFVTAIVVPTDGLTSGHLVPLFLFVMILSERTGVEARQLPSAPATGDGQKTPLKGRFSF